MISMVSFQSDKAEIPVIRQQGFFVLELNE
jgi:hypothetical protein